MVSINGKTVKNRQDTELLQRLLALRPDVHNGDDDISAEEAGRLLDGNDNSYIDNCDAIEIKKIGRDFTFGKFVRCFQIFSDHGVILGTAEAFTPDAGAIVRGSLGCFGTAYKLFENADIFKDEPHAGEALEIATEEKGGVLSSGEDTLENMWEGVEAAETDEEKIRLLAIAAQSLEARTDNPTPLTENEETALRKMFDELLRILPGESEEMRYPVAGVVCCLAMASSDGGKWLEELFSKNPNMKDDADLRDLVSISFGEFYRQSPRLRQEGLSLARRAFAETGRADLLRWMWPYLEDADFAALGEAIQSREKAGSLVQWWSVEVQNLKVILTEACLRKNSPEAGRFTRTVIKMLEGKDMEESLENCSFTRRDTGTLEEVYSRPGISPASRALALGHLARLKPERYDWTAMDRIISEGVSLGEKRAILTGMNGLRTEDSHEPIRAIILREIAKVKDGRLDKDLNRAELDFILAAREALVNMGVDPNSITDPEEELNRRFRSFGKLRRRQEGVLGTEFHSEFGFIAPHERISAVVRRDEEILKRFGLTFEQVAKPLTDIRAHYVRTGESRFEITVNGRRFAVQARSPAGILRTAWFQSCPFVDSQNTEEYDFIITDPATGETLFFPGLLAHLINVHHFFEGNVHDSSGNSFRMDPEKLIRFFHFQTSSTGHRRQTED